ncbi:hypothetical protein K1719_025979 [Acacia pycnantha]|nr:hypothetical protein K1719_025979 [Acacia pycnantha]
MGTKNHAGEEDGAIKWSTHVADVFSILRSNKYNGFPVIDHARSGEPLVIGLVLRSHLLVILQSKVDFQHSPLPSDPRGGARPIR